MKSYVLSVEFEEYEGRWSAWVPELVDKGAATWGNTKEEALRHIQEVAQLVIECLIEDGEMLVQ